MNFRRKEKIRRYEKNKMTRANRYLQRKNKRKRNRAIVKYNVNIYATKVIEIIYDSKFVKREKVNRKKKDELIKLPTVFSFTENTEETIQLLVQLVDVSLNSEVSEMTLDYRNCRELGIAASTVMDIILLGVKSCLKKKNKTMRISGYCSQNSSIKNILLASGIVKHLNLNTGLTLDNNERILFKLQGGTYNSRKSDKVATELKEYFQKCLSTQGYALTDMGENYLGLMFGEVINNCEIHAGEKSVWYTLGHYEVVSNESYGEFQLAIVSFGDSIYERLCGRETTDEIRKILISMDSVHNQYYNSKWNKEAMYTVLALQEGISRLKDKNMEGNRKRGTGTIRLLETFNKLGMTNNGKQALLSILSGRTLIRIDGNYGLKRKEFDDEIFGSHSRRIIAFNDENDIYKPANPQCVRVLEKGFPGTVISIKFYLDKKYLQKLCKGES